jgi:hypothetical protein
VSVEMCQAVKGNPSFEVVVYPGASQGFALTVEPWVNHNVFDVKAALDAQQRTDAFMDAHEVKRASRFSAPETSSAELKVPRAWSVSGRIELASEAPTNVRSLREGDGGSRR